MDTSLEHVHEEHAHELEPHVLVGRARICVVMLILSDLLSVLAILAGGGYLSALNTENAFKATGDFGPAFLPNLLVMLGLVLSGLAYYWWGRRASRANGQGPTAVFVVSWLLMLAAAIAEIWIGAGLRYGPPISAYQSMLLLITWFTGIHLLLTAFVGLLLFGRILRRRLAGREFIVEVSGYWWYYIVVSSVAMWAFGVFYH